MPKLLTKFPDFSDPAASRPDAGAYSPDLYMSVADVGGVPPDDPAPGSSAPPSGPTGHGGVGVVGVAVTGNQGIDGLFCGLAWNATTITYSFPASASFYGSGYGSGAGQYPDPAPFNGFAQLSAQQQGEVQRALGLITSYTGLTFTQVAESATTHAVLRFADSSSPSTSYAYLPNATTPAGDVFYGGTGRNPVQGNFDSGQAIFHEINHAMGMKDAGATYSYGATPANIRDIEYSVGNYANYIGSTAPFGTAGSGSSEQSYMMYDIAAYQAMYGVNFGKTGTSQTYTFSPTTGQMFINGVSQGTPYNNHIFETIWTGGATATYDFSNFNTNGTLDLRPGMPVKFSAPQLADLGYWSNWGSLGGPGPGGILAQGNIYNALLFHNNTASEVSGLVSGNGNNTIYLNDVPDTVTLGTGTDIIYAGSGGAQIFGGGGSDTLVVAGSFAQYALSFAPGRTTLVDQVAGRNGTIVVPTSTVVQFADSTIPLTALACFCTGTRIRTARGDIPVEALRQGDAVVVAGGGTMPARWIGHTRIDPGAYDPLAVQPVRICAGALGYNLPCRDLLLSPDHAVLLHGVLVHAAALVNGTTVRREPVAGLPLIYWHVELDTHAVLFANGMPAESFLSQSMEFAFDNWTGRVAPDASVELPYPRCKSARQLPAALRACTALALAA